MQKKRKLIYKFGTFWTRFEDERLIDFLIENGAQVNHAFKSGLTPLHLAVSYGRVKVVESLLRAGANIHATDNDFNTPLHLVNKPKNNWVILPFSSTAEDFYAICELLINNGANVFAHNTDGKTPLDMINRKSKFPTNWYKTNEIANKVDLFLKIRYVGKKAAKGQNGSNLIKRQMKREDSAVIDLWIT